MKTKDQIKIYNKEWYKNNRKKGCYKIDLKSINNKKLEEYLMKRFNEIRLIQYIPILCKAILYANIEEVSKPMKIMGLNRTAGEIVSMFDCWQFYKNNYILEV